MIQFYAPDIAINPILPEGESQHAIRVLRLGAGSEIPVTDGKGALYSCRVVDPHPKRALLEVVSVDRPPQSWPCDITVAVAPTKHLDRMEWMVEKLVEIGVNRIVPLLCRHSERKELKSERLRKIAISAMNQSLKCRLPIVDDMISLEKFVSSLEGQCQKFVGYCSDVFPRALLSKSVVPDRDTVVLIGPEGDFTPHEISSLIETGFKPVTFGDVRLRTETAALVAVETIHVINQII